MSLATDSPSSAAILSILLEAKQSGVGKLTRTALIKYLYLLDLFVAEERQGTTWTGVEWKFLHYGPYAAALADEIETLVAKSFVKDETRERGNKDYVLYSVGEWSPAKTLEELAFSFDTRSRLQDLIRKFAADLSGLLDFVYFRTEPMRDARPGDTLNFSRVKKLDYKADVRPVRVPVSDPKRIAQIKDLAKRIGQATAVKVPFSLPDPPIRDALYAKASLAEDDPVIEGGFVADLQFDGD